VHTAYTQWTQFESFPEFMEGVSEVRQVGNVHTHWTTNIAGVSREFDATIIEQQPDERVAWRSDAGPNHAGVITFHRLDDTHSRVTAQRDIDPDGFVENVATSSASSTPRSRAICATSRNSSSPAAASRPDPWRGDIDRPDATH
jgi:uncharacterized membrane protein